MAAAVVLLCACGKDRFTSRPQLTFKKVNSYTIPRGGLMTFQLEFTDKEGDLGDSIFIQTITTRCNASNRRISYRLPAFPASSKAKGEIEINFVNGQFLPGFVALPSPACGRPDTTTFRFWIRDKANNVSDTVQTDRPLIIFN